MFVRVAAPFDIPSSSMEGSDFFLSLPMLIIIDLFITVLLVGVKRSLIVVRFAFLCWQRNDIEHLFMCLLAILILRESKLSNFYGVIYL